MSQYLGNVSAYAYAVEKGYTGTEEEFAELMASYATVGQTAVTAAQTATTKASEAATSATTATNKASEATTAATTATTKAGEATTSAQTASAKASEASQSASTASQKASQASQSASQALTYKTAAESAKTASQTAQGLAETAQTAAETAQGKAETAQGAAEDAAESVSASAAQIAINTADISDLKENLTTVQSDALSPLLYNGFRKDGNGYYNADGNVVENAGWQYCSDFIPVAPNTDYTCWGYTTYMANQKGSIVWYTIDKKIISRSFAYGTLTSPSNAYYAKVSIYNSGNCVMFITGTTNPIFYIPYSVKLYSDNDNAIEKSIENVSDALLPISGTTLEYTDITVTEEEGYISKYGILQSGNNWKHAEVDVEGGATYYFTGNSASQVYALHIFDAYHLIKTIPETLGTGTYAQTVVMPATAKRVIINKSSSGIVLKKATSLSLPTNIDWLNGKKLYCGGDSITEGANVGTLPNGYKKTYGGYTATRNGMTYVSDGVGGSTMGKCTIDGVVHNNFIVSRYKNIPTDADFITLWFGWNDNAYGWKSARDAYCVAQYGTYYSALTSAQQAEVDTYKTWRQWIDVYVGASDSTDITTWSGAWNTVLTWLLDNCPSAHIGVVIAYGMQDALVTSLISICEKFGVSYIKAYDSHEFFSVGHSTGIGVDQATKRKTLYTLDNTHPNELGYELMSTSFEQFIRRM